MTRASATRALLTTAAASGYADGTYTGPMVDAYYGLAQEIVQGGRLVNIQVLRYPSDRRTSVNINRQALPMLRDPDQRSLHPLARRGIEAGERLADAALHWHGVRILLGAPP